MNLPVFKDDNKNLMLMQNAWKAALLPVVTNQPNQGHMIETQLSIGNNVINHLLGRNQLGWFLADIDGASTIYRSSPLNNKTLTLNSSAAVTVKLWVF